MILADQGDTIAEIHTLAFYAPRDRPDALEKIAESVCAAFADNTHRRFIVSGFA